MSNGDFRAIYGNGAMFHGMGLPASTDNPNQALVKYTYYGDTDFNGGVDFDDYSRTDSGFNLHKTGWSNGDFDYNGVVDFDDYALIDLAFNYQEDSEEELGSYVAGENLTQAQLNLPGLDRVIDQVEEHGNGIIDALAELLD